MAEQKKDRQPVRSVPEVAGQLIALYHDGFRCARIVELRWDPDAEQVTELRVAIYGGDEHTNCGYNGGEVWIGNRKHFIDRRDTSCFGVLIGRYTKRDLDAYVKGVLSGEVIPEDRTMASKKPKQPAEPANQPPPAARKPKTAAPAAKPTTRRPPPPETPEPRRHPPAATPEPEDVDQFEGPDEDAPQVSPPGEGDNADVDTDDNFEGDPPPANVNRSALEFGGRPPHLARKQTLGSLPEDVREQLDTLIDLRPELFEPCDDDDLGYGRFLVRCPGDVIVVFTATIEDRNDEYHLQVSSMQVGETVQPGRIMTKAVNALRAMLAIEDPSQDTDEDAVAGGMPEETPPSVSLPKLKIEKDETDFF